MNTERLEISANTELEEARRKHPLDPEKFTEEDIEKLKKVAPEEYRLLMEQKMKPQE